MIPLNRRLCPMGARRPDVSQRSNLRSFAHPSSTARRIAALASSPLHEPDSYSTTRGISRPSVRYASKDLQIHSPPHRPANRGVLSGPARLQLQTTPAQHQLCEYRDPHGNPPSRETRPLELLKFENNIAGEIYLRIRQTVACSRHILLTGGRPRYPLLNAWAGASVY